MSGQRRNAITLLEQIPEEKVSFVLQILQGIQEVDSTARINEKEEAYNRLESMRKKADLGLDYESELAEYRNVRYGYESADRH